MTSGTFWGNIISATVVPLVKWFIKRADKRRARREQEEQEAAEEEERKRLKAQTQQRIKEAKENFDDIDPSKIEV